MHVGSNSPAASLPTTGDKPPTLEGASITVIDSKAYVFGGTTNLLKERSQLSELYICDLGTCTWEKVQFQPNDYTPPPRCLHSANAWKRRLVIFGGSRTYYPYGMNDVQVFDIDSRRWFGNDSLNPSSPRPGSVPAARHSHLSVVAEDKLFIIGGYTLGRKRLSDVYIYGLKERAWIGKCDYTRHVGRSFGIAAYGLPPESPNTVGPSSPFSSQHWPGSPSSSQSSVSQPSFSLDEVSRYIYIYSNEEVNDVGRRLERFLPASPPVNIDDQTLFLNRKPSPSSLRHLNAAILGPHIVICGACDGPTFQGIEIWALDLRTLSWDFLIQAPGLQLQSCFWDGTNKLLIFGNLHSLADDGLQHQTCWDHAAIVDLEYFGIYHPPRPKLTFELQQQRLRGLEERVGADFDIICQGGVKMPCSRRLLERHWPWLQDQISRLKDATERAMFTDSAEAGSYDPRVDFKYLDLGLRPDVTRALLRYFYTGSLSGREAPHVLCSLLVISRDFQLLHLRNLAQHAMHQSLSPSTGQEYYTAADYCNCPSLRFRASHFLEQSGGQFRSRPTSLATTVSDAGYFSMVTHSQGLMTPSSMMSPRAMSPYIDAMPSSPSSNDDEQASTTSDNSKGKNKNPFKWLAPPGGLGERTPKGSGGSTRNRYMPSDAASSSPMPAQPSQRKPALPPTTRGHPTWQSERYQPQ